MHLSERPAGRSRSMASKRALKFPLPKLRAPALDDLEEQCRPILDRLGEDLEQVALVVAVDQDSQLGQLVQVFLIAPTRSGSIS